MRSVALSRVATPVWWSRWRCSSFPITPAHPPCSSATETTEMQPLDRLYAAARAARRRIVLAEGEDPRILAAAVRAEADGLAELTLLGRAETVAQGLRAAG